MTCKCYSACINIQHLGWVNPLSLPSLWSGECLGLAFPRKPGPGKIPYVVIVHFSQSINTVHQVWPYFSKQQQPEYSGRDTMLILTRILVRMFRPGEGKINYHENTVLPNSETSYRSAKITWEIFPDSETYKEPWARIFKRVWGPGIDSKEWIPPAYVAWRAGTITLFLLGS